MARLHVLRVFCADDGSGGNPLAAFLDGRAVGPERRQAVAADLGLSETVFVDDAAEEDEATGSASSQLCALLGRAIEIHQGGGSRILAQPLRDGRVELGGRCVLDEAREYDPPGG